MRSSEVEEDNMDGLYLQIVKSIDFKKDNEDITNFRYSLDQAKAMECRFSWYEKPLSCGYKRVY